MDDVGKFDSLQNAGYNNVHFDPIKVDNVNGSGHRLRIETIIKNSNVPKRDVQGLLQYHYVAPLKVYMPLSGLPSFAKRGHASNFYGKLRLSKGSYGVD